MQSAGDSETGFSSEAISFTFQIDLCVVEGQDDGVFRFVWRAFAAEKGSIVACDGSERLSIVRLAAEHEFGSG